MKRLFKFLINLALAMVAVMITFVILFFMMPSWQKVVVEKALEQDSDRHWLVESVRIQPMGVELTKLQVLEGPVGAEIKHVQLTGPFWMSPATGAIQITKGRIDGMYVDLKSLDVGDLTSEDWRTFLQQIRNDPGFWTERTNLVLSKLTASGWNLKVQNLEVEGVILLPGNEQIPVRWLVVEADSRDISKTRLEPLRSTSGTEL